MRSKGFAALMSGNSEFDELQARVLHQVHSCYCALLSPVQPWPNHLSCSWSLIWSHLECPFSSCVLSPRSKSLFHGDHSTRATLSGILSVCARVCHSHCEVEGSCLALCLFPVCPGMSPVRLGHHYIPEPGSSANCFAGSPALLFLIAI